MRKLLIVSTYCDGFGLTNHGRFTKFSPCQTLPLYNNPCNKVVHLLCSLHGLIFWYVVLDGMYLHTVYVMQFVGKD